MDKNSIPFYIDGENDMLIQTRQKFQSQKSDRTIRVEKIVQRYTNTRYDELVVCDVDPLSNKKVRGTERVLVADSIRRNYAAV